MEPDVTDQEIENYKETVEHAIVPVEPQPHNMAAMVLAAETPEDMVAFSTQIANALSKVIEDKNLFTMISNRKHVHVDGWTAMIAMLGILPREVKVVTLQDWGFEAHVELVRVADGKVMGRGSAICGNDEEAWAGRPAYARRSMAVTRATGKACRMAFGWLMSLAGYESTPKEEVDSLEKVANATQPITYPPRPPGPTPAAVPKAGPPKAILGNAGEDQLRYEVMEMLREIHGNNSVDVTNALIAVSTFSGKNRITGLPEDVSCNDISRVKDKWLSIIHRDVKKAHTEYQRLTGGDMPWDHK